MEVAKLPSALGSLARSAKLLQIRTVVTTEPTSRIPHREKHTQFIGFVLCGGGRGIESKRVA